MYNLEQINDSNINVESDDFLSIKSDSNLTPITKNKFSKDNKSVNNKCIGPCFPANKYLYHPMTFDIYKSFDISICPIKPNLQPDGIHSIMKCTLDDENKDYIDYNPFIENIQIASTHKIFLSQIYKLYNYNEILIFLKNDFLTLPLYSQRRLLNSIYLIYNDIITLDIFIDNLTLVYNNINNTDINNKFIKKIIIKLLKKKNKNINIFNFLEKNI